MLPVVNFFLESFNLKPILNNFIFKLMLDFEVFTQRFPIVRVTCIKNPMLCREFGVSEFSTDVFPYLITNMHDGVNKYEKFQDTIDHLKRDKIYNMGK